MKLPIISAAQTFAYNQFYNYEIAKVDIGFKKYLPVEFLTGKKKKKICYNQALPLWYI